MPRIIAALAALVLSIPAAAQRAPATAYEVDVTRPGTQVIGVTATVTGVASDTVDFVLPTWRSGRYVVLDFAATVRDVEATTPAGRDLTIEKIDKTTWRVAAEGAFTVTLSYGVFADSRDDRTRYLDATHCFFDASAVLMYNPERRRLPHRVTVRAPEQWDIVTGLREDDGARRTWISPDYDTLADSPFEMGPLDIHRFTAFGKPHEITVWGDADYDPEELVEDCRLIVEEQHKIFGSLPYDRYVFMIHIYPGGGGGTEHVNSTIMQADPEDFESRSGYVSFLGLVSHEMFHTWNVKSFRPEGITPYDFTAENYTPSLWIVEGTTSYYDDLTLARTGQMEPRRYIGRIATGIERTRGKFARFRQSLAASSWDAWIHYFALQRHADRRNAMVNFYGRGALASLCLDLEIRRLTANDHSLDTLMRRMYERYPLADGGYTAEDFRAEASEIAGADLEPWFARHIRGTEPLPLADALTTVGLELLYSPDETPHLGIFTRRSGDARVVTGIDEGSPAFGAGLVAGDRLVSIDTTRVSADPLADILDSYAPGDTVKVLYFRHDKLNAADITLAESPYGDYEIRPSDTLTDEQRRRFESWAGFSIEELQN